MANKTNNKGVSNEEIIAALLQHGTITEAAQAAGVSPRTVYDRMNDREFFSQYMSAKNDIMRSAVLNMTRNLSAAVDAIEDIMINPDNNAAVRLQAAQTLLNNAAKYTDILTHSERAAANESNSPFDVFGGI